MNKGKKYSILYEIGLQLVWIGANVFYRNFVIEGLENNPEDTVPTILVSNHQNGMMDPLVLCISNPRQLHFLTRADIFKSKWNNKILRSLNMLPVYRPHDRMPNMKEKNAETFQECTDRILSGNVVSLFPEGNHNNRKNLRALKTGVLKVATNAQAQAGIGQEVKIIPVGIEYSNYTRFREDILILYGEEISVADCYNPEAPNDLQLANKLRERINEALSKIMIDIKNHDYNDVLMETRELSEGIILEENKWEKNTLNSFKAFKEATVRIEKNLLQNPEKGKSLINENKIYKGLKQKFGLWEKEITEWINKSYSTFGFISASIIAAPLFCIGYITNALPFLFTEKFVKKNIKDPHFISSIRLAIGIFSFLIYYLIIFFLVWIVWGFGISLLTMATIIICGIVAIKYAEVYRKHSNLRKISKLSDSERSELFIQRDKLLSLISQLTIK